MILVGPIVLFQLICASRKLSDRQALGKLRSLVFFSYVILMLMPYQVTLKRPIWWRKKLNILNTYWAIWLPGIFSPFAVYLLMKSAKRIPVGIMEAAQIDGAESGRSYRPICMPLCKGALCSAAILCIYRLRNGKRAAVDLVIRCGDASLVRVLEQDQFRRDRTGIRRIRSTWCPVFWYFTEKNIW